MADIHTTAAGACQANGASGSTGIGNRSDRMRLKAECRVASEASKLEKERPELERRYGTDPVAVKIAAGNEIRSLTSQASEKSANRAAGIELMDNMVVINSGIVNLYGRYLNDAQSKAWSHSPKSEYTDLERAAQGGLNTFVGYLIDSPNNKALHLAMLDSEIGGVRLEDHASNLTFQKGSSISTIWPLNGNNIELSGTKIDFLIAGPNLTNIHMRGTEVNDFIVRGGKFNTSDLRGLQANEQLWLSDGVRLTGVDLSGSKLKALVIDPQSFVSQSDLSFAKIDDVWAFSARSGFGQINLSSLVGTKFNLDHMKESPLLVSRSIVIGSNLPAENMSTSSGCITTISELTQELRSSSRYGSFQLRSAAERVLSDEFARVTAANGKPLTEADKRDLVELRDEVKKFDENPRNAATLQSVRQYLGQGY